MPRAEGNKEGVVEADRRKHEEYRRHLSQETGRASYFPSLVRGRLEPQGGSGGDGGEAVSLWGGGR